MTDLDFYEIVDVLNSATTMRLGVSNTRGVIVGISDGANGKLYAVAVDDITYMFSASDLLSTGKRATRDSIYGGESLRVSPQFYSDDLAAETEKFDND